MTTDGTPVITSDISRMVRASALVLPYSLSQIAPRTPSGTASSEATPVIRTVPVMAGPIPPVGFASCRGSRAVRNCQLIILPPLATT
jgi:hypothetical protein